MPLSVCALSPFLLLFLSQRRPITYLFLAWDLIPSSFRIIPVSEKKPSRAFYVKLPRISDLQRSRLIWRWNVLEVWSFPTRMEPLGKAVMLWFHGFRFGPEQTFVACAFQSRMSLTLLDSCIYVWNKCLARLVKEEDNEEFLFRNSINVLLFYTYDVAVLWRSIAHIHKKVYGHLEQLLRA